MKKIFIVIISLIFTINSYSQCYDQNAKRTANRLAYMIVEQAWQGGDEITTTVNDCYYNDNTGKWSMNIIIEFYGQITRNYYRTDGNLKYNEYTNEYNFYPSYKNQKLQDYEAFQGLVGLTVIAIKLSQDK